MKKTVKTVLHRAFVYTGLKPGVNGTTLIKDENALVIERVVGNFEN